MDSSIIGKIEKARKYSEERDRVGITSFNATFRGHHNTYQVSFDSGTWHCQCHFFSNRGVCSHTMALQRILDGLLPKEKEFSQVV